MKISQNARKAIYIGTLFSIAYLVVYIARNALSAVTPQMLAIGARGRQRGYVLHLLRGTLLCILADDLA